VLIESLEVAPRLECADLVNANQSIKDSETNCEGWNIVGRSIMNLEFFADGAALPQNPGNGGCGVVVVHQKYWLLRSLYIGDMVTNNVAELSAIAEAIRIAKVLGVTEYTILSDSTYAGRAVTGVNRVWTNGELIAQIQRVWREAGSPPIRHIKGHAGSPAQELSDRLANIAALQQKTETHTVTFEEGQELWAKICKS